MARLLSVVIALSIVIIGDARQYYYAPLGPWGLESTVIHAKAMRKDSDLNKVQNTSEKTRAREPDDEEVQDDLEKAEEAFFHAVEKVEEEVVHAIDDEVETLFPHHKDINKD